MIEELLTDSQSLLLNNLKSDEYETARLNALEIRNQNNLLAGYLIPVGLWVLDNFDVISSLSAWRERDMKNFLVQFQSTFEKTKDYLFNFSIMKSNRILFLILDEHENLIGHLGLSEINSISVELDNLMRGNNGGCNDLMQLAEETLINFSAKILGVRRVCLRVLSFNFLAISIHQRLGFKVTDRKYLRRKHLAEEIHLEIVEREKADVKFSLLHMAKEL